MSLNLSLLKKPERRKFQTPFKSSPESDSESSSLSSSSSSFKLPPLKLSSFSKRSSLSLSQTPGEEDAPVPPRKLARQTSAGDSSQKSADPPRADTDWVEALESVNTPSLAGDDGEKRSDVTQFLVCESPAPVEMETPVGSQLMRKAGDTTHVSESPSPRHLSPLSPPDQPDQYVGGGHFELNLEDLISDYEIKPLGQGRGEVVGAQDHAEQEQTEDTELVSSKFGRFSTDLQGSSPGS